MPRPRTVTPELPSEIGVHDGLAYSLWLPSSPRGLSSSPRGLSSSPRGLPSRPRGGVVVLHGAGSCKENHHDFARAALGADLAAIAFDQRGHGESAGPMDGRALDDIAQMAALLRARMGDPDYADGPSGTPRSRTSALRGSTTPAPRSSPRARIALRGSSMGGYLALVAAGPVGAAAVVAICPASAAGLRRGLTQGRFDFPADVAALTAFLDAHDPREAIATLDVPVLLLHAEGDEQVPVQRSRELAKLMRSPRSRLIAVPGGHHRSIQHDPDLQAASVRFIARALADPSPARTA